MNVFPVTREDFVEAVCVPVMCVCMVALVLFWNRKVIISVCVHMVEEALYVNKVIVYFSFT